jgi:hypothetical protein
MRCVPIAGTVPKPLLIDTFVEPVTFQRNTADWPRSIVEGSTENSAITGTPGPGGELRGVEVSFATGAGAGGGGGITTFLPQAARSAISMSTVERATRLDIEAEVIIIP